MNQLVGKLNELSKKLDSSKSGAEGPQFQNPNKDVDDTIDILSSIKKLDSEADELKASEEKGLSSAAVNIAKVRRFFGQLFSPPKEAVLKKIESRIISSIKNENKTEQNNIILWTNNLEQDKNKKEKLVSHNEKIYDEAFSNYLHQKEEGNKTQWEAEWERQKPIEYQKNENLIKQYDSRILAYTSSIENSEKIIKKNCDEITQLEAKLENK